MKTVYVLVHPGLQLELQRTTAEVMQAARAGTQDSVSAATQTVQRFWDREIDRKTPAGKWWGELLQLAESAPDPPAPGYAAALEQLHEKLAQQLRAVS